MQLPHMLQLNNAPLIHFSNPNKTRSPRGGGWVGKKGSLNR
jgi:hypothetical protein